LKVQSFRLYHARTRQRILDLEDPSPPARSPQIKEFSMKWVATTGTLDTRFQGHPGVRCLARTLLPLAALIALVTLSFGVSAPAEAATYDIAVGPGFTYSPSSLTIQVGDAVRFIFAAGVAHTATSESDGSSCLPAPTPLFDFSSAQPTSSYTFDLAGTFPFMCTVTGHCSSGQHGVIVVTDATPAQQSTWGQLKAHYR
jgi:plastocyanin